MRILGDAAILLGLDEEDTVVGRAHLNKVEQLLSGLRPENGVWRRKDTGEVTWITRDERALTFAQMETTHLRNCVAQIFLRSDGWRVNYLPFLIEELKRRGDGQTET